MCSAPTSTSCSRSKVRRRTLAFLLFAIASTAVAEVPLISVRAVNAGALEAHPRQMVTFALVCENAGTVNRSFRLEIELPAGWKTLNQPETFSLEAASSEARIVSFLVPSQAAAGEHAIRCRLAAVDDEVAMAECFVRVTVLPEPSFDVKLLETPGFVLAGQELPGIVRPNEHGERGCFCRSQYPVRVRPAFPIGRPRPSGGTAPADGCPAFFPDNRRNG